MHDPRQLRQDPDALAKALSRRDAALGDRVYAISRLDVRYRDVLARVEELRAERNAQSETVARARRDRQEDVAQAAIARVKSLQGDLQDAEEELARLEAEVTAGLRELPNVPDDSIPDGGEADAREERRWEAPARESLPEKPLPHWEIGTRLGLVDFDRASKISGSRFAFYRGLGARLERALISFMMDHHSRRGYTEMWPPDLVSEETLLGTGQLPKFRDDMFETTDGRFLISTAEIPLTAYHRDEMLDASDLPIRYVAYSACFRSEAGAAGRDTRGLIRQHQFDKVELVTLCRPEASYEVLERMTADAASVLEALGLTYRIITLAAGDLGFSAAKTHDLEVWLPGSGPGFREISSVSNVEAFQARRLNIRFREGKQKPQFVHTLNGSGVAVGRTMAAILEQYQRPDGGLTIPEVLRPYMGGVAEVAPQQPAPVR